MHTAELWTTAARSKRHRANRHRDAGPWTIVTRSKATQSRRHRDAQGHGGTCVCCSFCKQRKYLTGIHKIKHTYLCKKIMGDISRPEPFSFKILVFKGQWLFPQCVFHTRLRSSLERTLSHLTQLLGPQ